MWHDAGATFCMRILITNDDGIYSPGISALAKAARQFGEVRVVAPDVEQSSMGHAITHSRPLSYKRSRIAFEGMEAWRVNGTPADCVTLGTHLWEGVDVVLSGINMGPNLGNSMWHSGTLAGAKQAVLLGIKGIALSIPVGSTEPDFQALHPHVIRLLEELLPRPGICLYNVNFPMIEPMGMQWTRQSVRQYDGRVTPIKDPYGRELYWINVAPLEAAEEGTDRRAVEEGFTSITPLRLDLTSETELETELGA